MKKIALVLLVAALAAGAIGVGTLLKRAPHASADPTPRAAARNLVLVTIDTLRADHVGAYGYRSAATPTLDAIARDGVRFDHAYATAPITLASHASMMTGRYPPGHWARDNGMRVKQRIPTLATILRAHGFRTAAFVGAFPLDRRFGLSDGFEVYSDRMPRGPAGKLLNERPARDVVDEALAWLSPRLAGPFFTWIHLFEPHAPYGDPTDGRPPIQRYDEEIGIADREVGRLLAGLGTARPDTLVIVVGDHGESFGEHGEVGHSLFVYDTTLRVPWIMMGPGIQPRPEPVSDPVCLVDLAPTALALLARGTIDADGENLGPLLAGSRLRTRELYAESFAPLLDFGWSPLRSIRSNSLKVIAAPRPELYDLGPDPGENNDLSAARPAEQRSLSLRADRYSGVELDAQAATVAATDREATGRLHALGYIAGDTRASSKVRPDPKDRKELAARMGLVVSGELRGKALEQALAAILDDDPRNPQAHLRLGDCLVDQGRFAEAKPHFVAAIAGNLPSSDAYVGLAACEAAIGRADAAERALRAAHAREPGNPVVTANIGILESKSGRQEAAIGSLADALRIDPELHEARFNLALAYARAGRREEAERETRELLRRLPANAPQRPEVERLLGALR